MKTLHQLALAGLKPGQTIRHDMGRAYRYSHYQPPAHVPPADRLTITDHGSHIGIDDNGNPQRLTEGAFWTAEAAQ